MTRHGRNDTLKDSAHLAPYLPMAAFDRLPAAARAFLRAAAYNYTITEDTIINIRRRLARGETPAEMLQIAADKEAESARRWAREVYGPDYPDVPPLRADGRRGNAERAKGQT